VEAGVDPPSQVEDDDAAIEASWVTRLDQHGEIAWQCPDCCGDPWAPAIDLDVIAKVHGVEGRSQRSKEKAELMFALMGYDIGGRIAEGGMGVVYEATHEKSGRRAAIKVMRRDADARPDLMLRFQREVDALMDLDHPNIVELHDHGILTERMYLVMEHTGGEPVSALLKREKPPLGRALLIADELLAALEHTHARGLVHRDVKPENVLIDERGVVKLVDFGLCRPITLPTKVVAATGTDELPGTPAYTAPELYVNPHDLDPRIDVWSAGLVLYELVTGHRQRLLKPKLKYHRVPPPLVHVIQRALAEDPKERTPTIADLRAQIRRTRPFWRARVRRGWRWITSLRAQDSRQMPLSDHSHS
jgi:serine/threonine-protein kinase